MAIANPRVHIICGICGSNKMMKFQVRQQINNDDNEEYPAVNLICDNCNSITGLDELMNEEKNVKQKK